MNDSNPTAQLAATMNRLYAFSLTTTSGGNLSIRDDIGGLWITPGGIDKSRLNPESIIHIDEEGNVEGSFNPSVETAFHKGIYEVRDDVKAVMHAHAPASSAFCIHNSVPNLKLIPQVYNMTGPAILSGYATPGTLWLSDNVVKKAKESFNTILLDNHGAITTGVSLLNALQNYEGLDVCAKAQILATSLGLSPVEPGDDALKIVSATATSTYDTFVPSNSYLKEREELCGMARRAYLRRLFTSNLGSLSLRISKDEFLITPFGGDRFELGVDDLVLVKQGAVEEGKVPDLWTRIHREVFLKNDEVNSVMTAMPASAMAYAITDASYNSRSLTEGYVVLRDLQKLSFLEGMETPDSIAEIITLNSPVLLISNGGLLAVGKSMLEALDRIEVAEVSMQATLWAQQMGNVNILDDEKIQGIRDAFGF